MGVIGLEPIELLSLHPRKKGGAILIAPNLRRLTLKKYKSKIGKNIGKFRKHWGKPIF